MEDLNDYKKEHEKIWCPNNQFREDFVVLIVGVSAILDRKVIEDRQPIANCVSGQCHLHD